MDGWMDGFDSMDGQEEAKLCGGLCGKSHILRKWRIREGNLGGNPFLEILNGADPQEVVR